MGKILTKPKKKSKLSVCITTYFDKNFQEMGDLCLKSIEAYAKTWGFDVVLFRKNLSKRPPAWNKILIVKKLLEKYDFVIWIDADAVFVRFDKNFMDEVVSGKDLYLVKHDLFGREVPNSGVFIMRKSDWSKKFLEDVWNKKEYIYHNQWENAAVIDLLGYKEILYYNKNKLLINGMLYRLSLKGMVTRLLGSTRFNRIVAGFFKSKASGKSEPKKLSTSRKTPKEVKWLGLEWNSLLELEKSIKPVVKHYPAKPYKERLARMREDIKMAGLI